MLWVPFKYAVSTQSEQLIRIETGEDKTIATILAERPELENAIMTIDGVGNLACAFRPPESPGAPIVVIIGEVVTDPPKKRGADSH
jgi:hypothetical protein